MPMNNHNFNLAEQMFDNHMIINRCIKNLKVMYKFAYQYSTNANLTVLSKELSDKLIRKNVAYIDQWIRILNLDTKTFNQTFNKYYNLYDQKKWAELVLNLAAIYDTVTTDIIHQPNFGMYLTSDMHINLKTYLQSHQYVEGLIAKASFEADITNPLTIIDDGDNMHWTYGQKDS